jgi:hypothetical protein
MSTYKDGDGRWDEGLRDIVAGDLAEVFTDKTSLTDFVAATFGSDKVRELDWTGSVEDVLCSLLDDCYRHKKIAQLMDAAEERPGASMMLTYTFSILVAYRMLV